MKSIRIRIHIRRPDLYPSAGYIPFRISIRPPDMYPSAGYEENLDLRESSASMWFHCCVSWYIVVTLHVFAHTMQIWTVKNQLWNVKDGGAAATQDQWYYFTILDKERSKSSHYFISMVGPSIGRSFQSPYVVLCPEFHTQCVYLAKNWFVQQVRSANIKSQSIWWVKLVISPKWTDYVSTQSRCIGPATHQIPL